MDGFTGLNIDGAHAQLQNFSDLGKTTFDKMVGAIENFINGVKERWASPNARSFSMDFSEKWLAIIEKYKASYYQAISGCNNAGSALARANGAAWSNVDSAYLDEGTDVYNLFVEDLNGMTGMATELVKVYRDLFKYEMDNAINTLSNVPRTIDFYSTDGSLLSAYSTGIDKLQEDINTSFAETFTQISSYIDTEVENIYLAKEAAVQQMSA